MNSSTDTLHLDKLEFGLQEADVCRLITRQLEDWNITAGPRMEVTLPRGGRADILVGGVVFEVKKPEANLTEHVEQLKGYMHDLNSDNSLEFEGSVGQSWKGILTNGRDWWFYEDDQRNNIKQTGRLDKSDSNLKYRVANHIDPTRLLAPPVTSSTWDTEWAKKLSKPFVDLAKQRRGTPDFDIKVKLWEDILKGVHFISPEDDDEKCELFASHTMLVVLARAVGELISHNDVDVTDGFAAWLENDAEGVQAVKKLKAELSRYNWRAGRDVLKDLYHAAIDKELRKDFGEFYTPDWLARAIVEEVCDDDWVRRVLKETIDNGIPEGMPQVIDPACGSGTFIYAAIKHLEGKVDLIDPSDDPEQLLRNKSSLSEILNSLVGGIDLHPIAVELAKTTKLLALPDVPSVSSEGLNIWLSDSLQWNNTLNQSLNENPGYVTIQTASEHPDIQLPEKTVKHPKYNSTIKQIIRQANNSSGPADDIKAAKNIAAKTLGTGGKSYESSVVETIKTLRYFIDNDEDGVWEWYLLNVVAPYRLAQNKVSRLIGNPPWVTVNNMEAERRAEFRKLCDNRNLWAGGKNNPHNNLASLFVATSVALYLEDEGKFSFVLPYSALKSDVWLPLREGKWGQRGTTTHTSAEFDKAWNLKTIKPPPFPSAASCVLFGSKATEPDELQNQIDVIGSKIDHRASWATVQKKLSFSSTRKTVAEPGFYAKKFRQGATLVPQPLVIVKDQSSIQPVSQTSMKFVTEDGKPPWKGTKQGKRTPRVEKQFIRPVISSSHLIPFGVSGQWSLIAPINAAGELFDPSIEQGMYPDLENYWDEAEQAWADGKNGGGGKSLRDSINSTSKLTSQLNKIQAAGEDSKTKVIYNRSGGRLVSSVAKNNLLSDNGLYYYFASSEQEAHYLCAIFNSPSLQYFFKEECRKSDRDFHTGPPQFLPIPEFNSANQSHMRLSKLSVSAHDYVETMQGEIKKIEKDENTSKRKAKTASKRMLVLSSPEIISLLADIDEDCAELFPNYVFQFGEK